MCNTSGPTVGGEMSPISTVDLAGSEDPAVGRAQLDGSEIRRSPLEVGTLSPLCTGF